MKSLWDDQEAAKYPGDLLQRVYTSRLLGLDPSLVLHGGGNTSVKVRETNIVGEEQELLYVKGSGWDLETIEAEGFAPVRMDHLLKLAKLETLSDLDMVRELRASMTNPSAPTPSVETILHALLPYKYVDHTHADALIAVTNTENGEDKIREIYGDSVIIIPYVMPGFILSQRVAELFPQQQNENTIGMVLLNHGIFSFGDTAQESYERMIDLVGRAEQYLTEKQAWELPYPSVTIKTDEFRYDLSSLRKQISAVAGRPMLLSCHQDDSFMSFALRDDVVQLSQQGPATPDHVIRTKRLPMLGRDVKAYADAYEDYFNNCSASYEGLSMLDPAPRMVLDPELGFCSVGKNAKDADIVRDIYRHTVDIISSASAQGGYKALPAQDIFDVEYWELEQAKLRKSGDEPEFTGEVVLVTGAASGIGRACVDAYLKRGAAVIGMDINPDVCNCIEHAGFLGITADLGDVEQIRSGLEQGVRRFGGIDMLVLNAGIFPASCDIENLHMEDWHKVMSINLDANLDLMRECYPLLKNAPRNGRIVIIGSRNVLAPGPGAAAYSASKAALNQLARIAALEWGGDGIRINSLHPDAVFDTGIWSDEILQARAEHYGMTVEQYKTRNVLKTEICSTDVAELAAEMCGKLFAPITGAQLPVDGGNDRVI